MKLFTFMVTHVLAANVHNRRIPIATLVLAVLFGLSFTTLTGDYRCNLEDYRTYLSSEEPLLGLNRPSPVRIFAAELSQQLDAVHKTNSSHQIEVGASDKMLNQSFALFEPLDSVYIFKVIVSLLTLFISFDTVVREREQGTLALCIVNSADRRMWTLSKIVGSFLSAGIPVLVTFAFGSAFVLLLPDVPVTAELIVRLSLFLLVSLLFVAVFVCLGTFVSAASDSSSHCLIVLVGIWAIFVFCIPGMSSNISQAAAPAPQNRELDRKLNALWAAGMFDLNKKATDGRVSPADRIRTNADILSHSRNLESSYFATVDRQTRLYNYVGRVSPVVAYVDAVSVTLLGGVEDARNLVKQLRQRRDVLAQSGVSNNKDIAITQLSLTESIGASLVSVIQLAATALLLALATVTVMERRSIT